MKALKIVGLVFGGVLVLGALVLALALTSSVQTWAVRKAAGGQPGLQLEVGKVSAGLSAAAVTDLRIVQDGTVVTAKSISARYAAFDYLGSGRVNADRVAIEDLVVDLRAAKTADAKTGTAPAAAVPPASGAPSGQPPAPADASQPATPFEGVLKSALIPLPIRVASFLAKGRALLPANQEVLFELKATGVETGQRGRLEWTVDFADATPDAPLRALRSTGSAFVRIATDGRIDLVEVDTITAAMGPQLPPDRIQIVSRLEAPGGGDESYSTTLSLLRGAAPEPLLTSASRFTAASREIAGTWELSVRSEQLAAVLAGLGLPELAAAGSGKFSVKPETGAVAASGDLQATVAKLEKLDPALAAIGSVRVKLGFDGGLSSRVAQLNRLALEATTADGRKFADISAAQRVGFELDSRRVTFADARSELARIQLLSVPLAWAAPALKGFHLDSGDLSLALAVEAEPDGSRVRARALEPLALRAVTLREGDRQLLDRVTLTVRPGVDYTATRIQASLDDLAVSTPAGDSLSGKIGAAVVNLTTIPAVSWTTELGARIVSLLAPHLPVATGPLSVVTSTAGRLEGDRLELARAAVTVSRAEGAPLVALETQQPLVFDLKSSALSPSRPAATAAVVRFGEIPLAWVDPFVAGSKFSGALAGGAFAVSLRSLDDLTIDATEPLVLRGVAVALEGRPQVEALDVSANLTATKKGSAVSYDLRRLELKQGPALLAGLALAGQATLGGDRPVVAAKGTLEADLPALLRQPALVPYATLSGGRLTVAFDANVAEAIQAKAALSAKNLVAKADRRVLGDLDLKLDAAVKPDGSGTISAPLTLVSASRKSDLAVTGTFGRSSDKKTFLLTGRIASDNLVVEDLQPLAGLAPAPEPAASPARPSAAPAPRPAGPAPVAGGPARPPTADTQPFWQGVNGKVELDLKRVLYGQDYVIGPVRGSAVITDTRLSLDGLEGRFKGNPFKLSGGIAFTARQPKPYSLAAAADIRNLDIGEILRAAAPNEKPVFETKASLVSQLAGQGGTLPDLFKNAYGKFELTGTEGITRLLARRGTASTITNVASLGLAILGASKGSQGLTAAAELTQLLNEVRFDRVKVQVERAADLSFKLTTIEIVSPILRTSGTGTIASRSTDDIANAPMNITLQLGAKGSLAYALNQARLLTERTDEQGYNLMSRTFTIGGTPSKPDNAALWSILLETGLGGLLGR